LILKNLIFQGILLVYLFIDINKTDSDNNDLVRLNPNYITGFVDGEGCFHISLRAKSGRKVNYAVDLSFSIGLGKKDQRLLELIQAYFGGIGKLSVNDSTALWRVRAINDLKVLIDHFDRYPLLTKKRLDFIIFKEAWQLIVNKEHLTEEGLRKMVSLRASINKGLSEALRNAFPDVKPMILPSTVTEFTVETNSIDPYWMVGFTEAEGCFFVVIQENNSSEKGNASVKIGYQVTQHIRDTSFIKSLKTFFGCGRSEPSGRNGISFRVSKIKDIVSIIVPFFEKYPLLGSKSKDFLDWKEVVKIMESKSHLTPEGLSKIKEIKSGMNSLREFEEE